MSTPEQHSRLDLSDLKAQIIRRLGPERSQRYFFLLNKFLSQKLGKSEFDKFCSSTIGRENISLHNHFIRVILLKAHRSRTPPPSVKNTQKSDGLTSLPSLPSTHATQMWSNGDILPPSPRKIRSNNRRIKDRQSPLASNGKIDLIPRLPLENGQLKNSSHNLHHVNSEFPTKINRQYKDSISIEEEEHRMDFVTYDRFQIRAPLGIPFCSASVGGSRNPLSSQPSNNSTFSSSQLSGEICDTENLKKRMEEIAESQGLGGVSIDCANLLNNGLDVYLKQLIQSCINVVGRRPGIEGTRHLKNGNSVSMLDFRVAMELNPRQLGEDWPMLLEKVSYRSFEE